MSPDTRLLTPEETQEILLDQIFDLSKVIQGQARVYDQMHSFVSGLQTYPEDDPKLFRLIQFNADQILAVWREKYKQLIDFFSNYPNRWREEGSTIILDRQSQKAKLFKSFDFIPSAQGPVPHPFLRLYIVDGQGNTLRGEPKRDLPNMNFNSWFYDLSTLQVSSGRKAEECKLKIAEDIDTNAGNNLIYHLLSMEGQKDLWFYENPDEPTSSFQPAEAGNSFRIKQVSYTQNPQPLSGFLK
jgi:hypothetical protein